MVARRVRAELPTDDKAASAIGAAARQPQPHLFDDDLGFTADLDLDCADRGGLKVGAGRGANHDATGRPLGRTYVVVPALGRRLVATARVDHVEQRVGGPGRILEVDIDLAVVDGLARVGRRHG